jgi:hypothetical protein
MSSRNVKELAGKINSEFKRMGCYGCPNVVYSGLRAKTSLTSITVHDYHGGEPWAVVVTIPEELISFLSTVPYVGCRPEVGEMTMRHLREKIEEHGTRCKLLISDCLEWDNSI